MTMDPVERVSPGESIDALMFWWWCRLEQLAHREPKGKPNDYMTLCPAHADSVESLHVSQGTDKYGRPCVRLHCFADCTHSEIVEAVGVQARDLFIGPPEDPPANESSTAIEVRLSRKSSATATATASATGQVPLEPGDRRRSTKAKDSMLRRLRNGEVPEFVVPLDVSRIPPQAYRLRSVAEGCARVMGLRLTDGDVADVPFSGAFVVEMQGLDPREEERGRKWLHALARYRALRCVGSMPPIGEWPGAKLFQPYGFDLVDVLAGRVRATPGIDFDPVIDVRVEGPIVLKPAPEVGHEQVVGQAIRAREVSAVGVVAGGDGARAPSRAAAPGAGDRNRVHAQDYNEGPGLHPTVEEVVQTLKDEFDATEIGRDDDPSCGCCGGHRWWRLRTGGPPTCARCHPPVALREDEIEWLREPEAVPA